MSSVLECPQPATGELPLVARGRIDQEDRWRNPEARLQSSPDVLVQRWTHTGSTPLDVSSDGHPALHCIALNLKCTSLTFEYAGRPLIRGRVPAGVAHVAAPGASARASYSMQGDVLHLYASQKALGECYEDLFNRSPNGDLTLAGECLLRDPAIERLGQALAVSQSSDAALGKIYMESVSLAIVSRLVSRQYAKQPRNQRSSSELPKWRMTRVMEFIDANLAEPIGLEEMAQSTGLTRMHFAAQFRAACGLRPHEYLLRRRIEHAQSLLLETRQNMLDIALSCGFRSQAHFTTVFKRFVGAAPLAWRKRIDEH
ncbi:transcriptional regulator, AraC family [Paraburkholderia atlantica]|uniref:Transcriptional regulator, AraC family n=1 Tax=Paraburkholderia atlantica TaxID=2654982 RepID=D5WFH4_PARAM|nr:AraC family transcriptional regulator [Paraburkholderia atlantica]ADG19328.1 transcriptional regulator, AraC family [Paraburkholderia atlantica]